MKLALAIGLLVGAAPAPQDKAACTAQGGTWTEKGGRGHPAGCRLPTKDGGKACTDSAQCEGACVRGACSDHTPVTGCGIMENGKTVCRD